MLASKRGGLARAKLVGFVLAAVVLVVWLVFARNVGEASSNDISERQCELSVERNARYRFAGLNLSDEIDCPMRKIVLEKESGEEAKKKVADAMYTCWKQFGQGKINLFNGEGIFCNICSIIDVKTKEPVINFTKYLMETPSPKENLYYYDYLSSYETEKAQSVVSKKLELDGVKLEGDELSNRDGENKYAVIFVYAKGEENFKKIVDQLTGKSRTGKLVTPVALGTGVAAGASIGLAILAAPVTVPAVLAVGTVAIVGVGVFSAVEYVGSIFNHDRHTEWIAFNVLREWNAEEIRKLGCQNLVGSEK